MIMDDWKRCYSNEDTKTVAIPQFWTMLDTEGYSLWEASYKYDSELTKVFMTCNLVIQLVWALRLKEKCVCRLAAGSSVWTRCESTRLETSTFMEVKATCASEECGFSEARFFFSMTERIPPNLLPPESPP